MTSVFVDVCVCVLFSKKVTFIADIPRKYLCRSDIALLDTHSFGVPICYFSVFWWDKVT